MRATLSDRRPTVGMALEVTREQVIGHRWRAHQLDRGHAAVSALDDVALLDVGVQDAGPVAARWALVNRGLRRRRSRGAAGLDRPLVAAPLPSRGRRGHRRCVRAPERERRRQAGVRRVQGARQAGVPVLEALAVIARTQRDLVRNPTVKGELSTALTERLEPHSLRYCRVCAATHAWENPFRMAPLQGGLELQPGTSPPVLQRITGHRPRSSARRAPDRATVDQVPRLPAVLRPCPATGRGGPPRLRGQGRPGALAGRRGAGPRRPLPRGRRWPVRAGGGRGVPHRRAGAALVGCDCWRPSTPGSKSASVRPWWATRRTRRSCGATWVVPARWCSTARWSAPGGRGPPVPG